MSEFLTGVIEGFYGRPWSGPQRERLLGWMQDWKMHGHNRDVLFDLHPYLVDLNEELTRLLREAGEPERALPYRGGLADKLLELGRGRQLPTGPSE